MDTRPLYVLPFRVVMAALLGVFLLGLAGGALGSWLTVRRVLRVTPEGTGVIERVEQVTVRTEDALAAAVGTVAPSTIPLVDEASRIVRQVLAVTADGVLVGAGPAPAGRVRLQRSPDEIVNASVVRIYHGASLFFLRAPGTFPVPTLDREVIAPPGTSVVAVAAGPAGAGPRALLGQVETLRVHGSPAHARASGLAEVPVLAGELPPSFQGAPVVGTNGRVVGVALVDTGGTVVIPAGAVDALLQDLLRHPEKTEVRVLAGLQGRWERAPRDAREPLSFLVGRVTAGSPFSLAGLRPGDVLEGVNGRPFDRVIPLLRPLLEAARQGTTLKLDVRRDGEARVVALAPPVL